MLMPKKVKYRKQQRGRMRGKAWRGSELSFGDFGLKVMECGYITDRQIEASRIAMTRFIKRGGKVVSVAGPPEPAFARDFGVNWLLLQAIRVLRLRVRRKAKRRGVTYSFLFMKASGDQLREIRTLVDSGAIRPVIDRVFPFESTLDALAYVENGRAKGKVVVSVTSGVSLTAVQAGADR